MLPLSKIVKAPVLSIIPLLICDEPLVTVIVVLLVIFSELNLTMMFPSVPVIVAGDSIINSLSYVTVIDFVAVYVLLLETYDAETITTLFIEPDSIKTFPF
jgi:hypothetical protein